LIDVWRRGEWLNPQSRPDWCDIGSAGRFAIDADGGRFDRHFHDAAELWFIGAGQALVSIGDESTYVGPGDIVLTQPGVVHDIVEMYEPLSGFFCHPSGNHAHRHAELRDADGHDVPLRPRPTDFPAS
jgi:mannose-6-phosphate isomerase-like protein (cupin superfamily)